MTMRIRPSAGILLVTLLFVGCTVTNEYGPYYGRVIDTETKAPIEGAAVLAVYMTEQYGLAGAVPQFAEAQETVTDTKGEFKIPVMRVCKFRLLSGWQRHPYFTIFKPAYGCYPNHRDVKPIFVPNGSLPSNQYVTVELPNVRYEAGDERLRNAACLPGPSVPDGKYTKLFDLLQQERMSLGLEREEPR